MLPPVTVLWDNKFHWLLIFILDKIPLGSSLMGLWLGLSAFTAVARFQSLFGELKSLWLTENFFLNALNNSNDTCITVKITNRNEKSIV